MHTLILSSTCQRVAGGSYGLAATLCQPVVIWILHTVFVSRAGLGSTAQQRACAVAWMVWDGMGWSAGGLDRTGLD